MRGQKISKFMFDYENAEKLSAAIIKKIAFFDLFNYPLTAYEIRKELNSEIEQEKIIKILSQEIVLPIAIRKIEGKNGFYFLVGREQILSDRQKRYNYSYRKIKIARRFARVFSFCPFVQAIALANSIGGHNLRDESDIDFFIITSARRIWLSRLYCAGLAKILNRRPTENNKKDKLCLSFYVSEDRLDLSDLKLKGEDPYFDCWRRSLVLLYNRNEAYKNFLSANFGSGDKYANAKISKFLFFTFLEKIAKKWQLAVMSPLLRAKMNDSDGVVINDKILKLYTHDRRREYAEKYGNKIREIFKEIA